MKKKYVVSLAVIGVVLIFAGCQEPVSIQDDVKNELEKNKQTKESVLQSQDLSSISGDAKAISEKISSQNKSVEVKGTSSKRGNIENKDLNSNKNNMEEKQVDGNELPIDMGLAKTCKSAVLKTSMGDVEIEFFGDKAPTAVANFCTLSKKGFYDGVIFHRIIKDFMIQGGDPDGTGMGGPGYKFKDEIYTGNSNAEYTISLANAGPDTNGSQFFINTKANNFLDTKHTVFGKVVKGQDVVDKMEQVETGMADKPVEDVVITEVVIGE